MKHIRNTPKISIRAIAISIIIGVLIVWILLSKIDPRDIPRVISKIPLQNLVIAFMLYAIAVFLRALRFKVILRTYISMKHLLPIVSLYVFFANILPMRSGELSYVYLLKKHANTPGTKGFAALLVSGFADFLVIIMTTIVIGWHFRDILAEFFAGSTSALKQRIGVLGQLLRDNITLLIISVVFLTLVIAVLIFIRVKFRNLKLQKQDRHLSRIPGFMINFLNLAYSKIREVGHELGFISFDIKLLIIIVCSILIISFRFIPQWYLAKSMGIGIGIWEISFALLFGVLFSLVPIHGLAGFGTIEAPWVLALIILNVPQDEAIASGFGLHIITIIYCMIIGLYGMLSLRFMPSLEGSANIPPKHEEDV